VPDAPSGLVESALGLASSGAVASPLPPPPPRRPFVEEALPSADKPYVIIVGTKQSESEDRQSVFVEGTLHNQGTGPTKQIQVKVEALDEAGHVVTTATALTPVQMMSRQARCIKRN